MGVGALKGLDENGTPGDTDLTLVTGKNGSLRPHRAQAQVSFAPTSASQMATLDLAPGKQAQVSFDNVTSGVVPSRVSYELGQAAHYQGVLPQGTSLEMRPLTDGLETVYMVQSAGAGTGLTEHLTLPAGYTVQQGTGEIDVLDATGTQVAVWGGGFATDAGTSEREGDVTLQLQSVQGGVATALVVVDPAWLNDPQRVFPVRVDPVLRLYSSTYGSGSTFIENGRGTGEWYADPIRVGTYDEGYNVNRSLITYPIYQIPAHSRIIAATLWAYETWSWSCSPTPIDAYRITSWWPSNVTWANQPWVNPGADAAVNYAQNWSPSGYGGGNACGGQPWMPMDISSTVACWYYGSCPNYGEELIAGNEADDYGWKQFAGSGSGAPPLLDVTFESYGTNPIALNQSYLAPSPVAGGFQSVTVTNQGQDSWTYGNYSIGYHLYNASGTYLGDGPGTYVPTTVSPGGSVTFNANIQALAPGDYTTQWDIYENGVGWLSQLGLGIQTTGAYYHSTPQPTLLAPAGGYAQIPSAAFGTYPTSGSTTSYSVSFETWFKTAGAGVILGQTANTLPPNAPSGWVPALYVDTAGALRESLFWPHGQNVANGPYNDGKSHQVVATYSNGTDSLYVDGKYVTSTTGTENAYSTTYTYLLGTGYTTSWTGSRGGWWPFAGTLDDVAVYPNALSAAQVSAHYSAGAGYKQAVLADAPTAYYRMDDAVPSATLSDSSGHANNASWTGGGQTSVTPGLVSGDSDGAMVVGSPGLSTLTPTLMASSTEQNQANLRWEFQVCTGPDAVSGSCATSGWISTNSWTIPNGVLSVGKPYYWTAFASYLDPHHSPPNPTYGQVIPPAPLSFTPLSSAAPQAWAYGFDPYASFHGGVNTAIGNYVYSNTDFSIKGAGPPLQLARTYNSLDTATLPQGRWFGTGWSSTYEANLSFDGAGNALVVYPDGRREYLPLQPTSPATWGPAPGYSSVLTKRTDGSGLYDLKHQDQSVWSFRPDGLLDSTMDPSGHKLQLTWNLVSGSCCTTAVIADLVSGRTLTVTFSAPLNQGGHVTSIATKSVTVGGSQQQLKWTYSYDANGVLNQACDPTDTSSSRTCTTYVNSGPGNRISSIAEANGNTLVQLGYDSSNRVKMRTDGLNNQMSFAYDQPYKSTVLADSPFDYWRLGETSGTNAANLGSSGLAGTYTGNVTLGNAGPIVGDPDTAAGFDGSTAYVTTAVSQTISNSISAEAWINVPNNLQNGFIVGKNPVNQDWELFLENRGGSATLVWRAQGGPDLTAPAPSANFWHHVVATQSGANASLYVDGSLVASSTAMNVIGTASGPVEIGRYNSGYYFSGLIDEVAVYPTALTASQVMTHYAAGSAKRTTITDPLGHTTKETYNAVNELVKHVNEDGTIRSYTFDQRGFLNSITDGNGHITQYTNDPLGNVLTAVDPAGDTTYYSYDAQNHPTDSRDPRSQSATDNNYDTKYTWANGNKTSEADPLGDKKTWTYTVGTEAAIGGGVMPANLLKTASDANGNITTYAYDAQGNLRETVDPSGLKTDYTYDELGREISRKVTSDTFPNGVVTTTAYDLAGRVSTSTEPAVLNPVTSVTHQLSTAYGYDKSGNLLTITQSDLTGGDPSRKTTLTYDGDDRLKTATDPMNHTVSRNYDGDGNVVQSQDQLGRVTQTTYTVRNQPQAVTLKNFVDDPINPGTPRDVQLSYSTYDPAGLIQTEKDAMGRVTQMTYDAADRLVTTTLQNFHPLTGNPANLVLEQRTYDKAGNVTKKVEGGGSKTTTYTYDAAGRLATSTLDPGGLNRTTTNAYDANGNLKSATLSDGTHPPETTSYGYDAGNRPTSTTVSMGGNGSDLTTTTSYDQRGLPLTTVDPRGNASGGNRSAYTTSYSYDAAGRLSSTLAPPVQVENGTDGTASTQQPFELGGYDTYGDLTQISDPRANVTTYGYDALGRETKVAYPSYAPPGGSTINATESFSYDAVGNLLTHVDRRGQTTTLDYDMRNRLVRETDPLVGGFASSGFRRFYYNDASDLTAQVDQNGARQDITYDDLDRTRTMTQEVRSGFTTYDYVSTYDHDALGDLTYAQTPLGETTTAQYNPAGEVTQITDPLGKKTTVTHDLEGNVAKTTDPLGRSTVDSYDLAGRLSQETHLDSTGATLTSQSWGYDPAGNLTSATDPSGHTTSSTYDALNRQLSITEPVSAGNSITTSFGYDASGNRVRLTDGNGHSTLTTFNVWDLPEKLTEPSTQTYPNLADRTWTRSYESGGQVSSETQPGGINVGWTYDNLGRPTKKQATQGSTTTTTTYGWDLASNLIAVGGAAGGQNFGYDDRGLLTSSSGVAGSSSFVYNGDGEMTDRTDAAGHATFTWTPRGQLATVTDPLTGIQQGLTYDDAGQLKHIAYGTTGAVRDYTYDGLGQLKTDTVTSSSGQVSYSAAYGYDLTGNVTSKQLGSGQQGAGSQAYTYDWANRLSSWQAPSGTVTNYQWDGAGNRIQAGSNAYTYNERNQLVSGAGSTYTYSASGNLTGETGGQGTESFTYDPLGRLTQTVVTPSGQQATTTTYAYDGLDRPVKRNSSSLQYAGSELVPVMDPNGVEYSMGPDGALEAVGAPGAGLLAVSGVHGDLEATINGSGSRVDSQAFDPFGNSIGKSTSTSLSLGFQGAYTDPASSLVQMGARWYDPTAGRFTSDDSVQPPVKTGADANLYAYGRDDPLGYVDPSGHEWTGTLSNGIDIRGLAAGLGAAAVGGAAGLGLVAVFAGIFYPSQPMDFYDPSISGVSALAAAMMVPWPAYAPPSAPSGGGSWGGSGSRWYGSGSYAGGAASAARSAGAVAPPVVRPIPPWEIKGGVAMPPLTPSTGNGKVYLPDGVHAPASPMATQAPATGPPPILANHFEGTTLQQSAEGAALSTLPGAVAQHEAGTADPCGTFATEQVCLGQRPPAVRDAAQQVFCTAAQGVITDPMVAAIVGVGCQTVSARPESTTAFRNVSAGIGEGRVGSPFRTASDNIPNNGSDLNNSGAGADAPDLAETCAANSFSAGTLVLMGDGSKKPIEQLKVGDKIMAGDAQKGVDRPESIERIIVGHGLKHLFDIHVANGDIEATYNHPFWVVEKKAYVWARDLKPGQHLLLADGRTVPIVAISNHRQITTVYNLSISSVHTFYVGGQSVLVHNACLLGRKQAIEDYIASHPGGGFDADFLNIQGNMAGGKKGVGGWNWTRNKRFIEDAIASGDEVRLVTDPNVPLYSGGNVYQRELKYLQGRGYGWQQVDDYWQLIRSRP